MGQKREMALVEVWMPWRGSAKDVEEFGLMLIFPKTVVTSKVFCDLKHIITYALRL